MTDLAGRIANPPWGALLRSRIHQSGGLAMIASILKRTLEIMEFVSLFALY